MNTNKDDRAWYCIETYDDVLDHHAYIASYSDEASALRMLRTAGATLPRTTHIYYWIGGGRPFAPPPEGYSEGPLAHGNPHP